MHPTSIRITHRQGNTESAVTIGLSSAAPSTFLQGVNDDNVALEWSHTLCDSKRVNHASAVAACAALGDGWRLPTRVELLSLVDDTRSNPAIDVERFPDTKPNAYWTSTPLASDSSCAWFVNFDYGDASSCRRVSYDAFVRAVRSVPAGQ